MITYVLYVSKNVFFLIYLNSNKHKDPPLVLIVISSQAIVGRWTKQVEIKPLSIILFAIKIKAFFMK